MKIFLIGMPASGKTTLGKALADRLDHLFIDLDVEIEKKENCSIKDLFAQRGEPYFRQVEASLLREVSMSHRSFVMATGGGTPCFYEGIEFMNSVGVTVFLDVSVDELSVRLNRHQAAYRPLLHAIASISETLQQLRSSRLRFYEQATYRVTQPDPDKLIDLLTTKR
jgi:shikimate kinase